MAVHHNDWQLHIMRATTEELAIECSLETDPKKSADLYSAFDFRHFYNI